MANPTLRRACLLAACVAAGAVVAAAAHAATGSDWAWLALPLAVTLGWLAVADPTRCEADRAEQRRHPGGR